MEPKMRKSHTVLIHTQKIYEGNISQIAISDLLGVMLQEVITFLLFILLYFNVIQLESTVTIMKGVIQSFVYFVRTLDLQ